MTVPALERIGHCEIESQIGSGGMGTVFRARHTHLGTTLAVKLLKDDLAKDRGYVDRFLREARLAAQINHPNVVRVFDAGEENGLYYIVMEFVEGTDLLDELRRGGAIPVARARDLLRQTVSGLAAAHAIGLVHRDIKPENLLLTREGVVKISDFGLARNVDSVTRLTQTGIVLGTPAFMSPEQCEGRPLGPGTDLYSLGASFFYLVTGRLPYQAARVGELLMKHMEAPVPFAAEVNPGVDAEMSELLARMMAKRPSRRFRDAGELLGHLDGTRPAPLPARASTPSAASVPAYDGRRALLPVAAVVALLAVAGLGWWGLRGRPPEASATTPAAAVAPAAGAATATAAPAVEAARPADPPGPESAATGVPVVPLPGDAAGCAREGTARLERGDLAGAEEAFRRAAELGSDPALARQAEAVAAHRAAVERAERACGREDWGGAQAAYEEAMGRIWVDATEARLERLKRFLALCAEGEADLTAGRGAEAEEAFAAAREIFDSPLLRVRLEAAREARRGK